MYANIVPSGGPHRHPTPARKLRHSPPLRVPRQRLGQHPQTLLPTLLVGSRRLLHRAPRRVERRRTLQMRRRILQPHQPAVMQMREDCPNRTPMPLRPQRLRPPRARIQMLQQELVHRIVDGISFQQARTQRFRWKTTNHVEHPIRSQSHSTSATFQLFRNIILSRHP